MRNIPLFIACVILAGICSCLGAVLWMTEYYIGSVIAWAFFLFCVSSIVDNYEEEE